MRASGVPLTSVLTGARPAGYGPATRRAVALAVARTTVNPEPARLVATTSVAVSVTRSRRPVSACPTWYRRAANGVAVVPAPVTQRRPAWSQARQA